jgi:hypothetical protein
VQEENDINLSKERCETGKPYKVRSIEVKQGVAFDVGRIHRNVSFSLIIDINDERAVSYSKGCAVREIKRWLEQEMQNAEQGLDPLDFDPETLNWNYSEKGRPLQLISITNENTRKLRDLIEKGMSEFGGYTYWIFRDGTTIGRRKIR